MSSVALILEDLKTSPAVKHKIVSGQTVSESLVYIPLQFSIGRNDTCNVVIAGSVVSSVHCRIICGPKIELTDLSSNGTFVNGVKIGKNRTVHLTHGDTIQIARPNKTDDGSATADYAGHFKATVPSQEVSQTPTPLRQSALPPKRPPTPQEVCGSSKMPPAPLPKRPKLN